MYVDHRDLHVLTHSFPTRRSSDLDITRTLRGDLDPNTKVVDAGRLGAQLLSLVQDWLTRLGSNARITPVIDLNQHWAVDQHDPPDPMREQVPLRDQHCEIGRAQV